MDERGGGLVLQLKDTREEGQYWIDPSYNDVMKNFPDIRTPIRNILKKILDSIYSAISTLNSVGKRRLWP
jgi:hypothetical protein